MLGYFGLRKIEIRELSAHYFCFKCIVLSIFPHRKVGNFERFLLNNELLPFQLGPLDQVMNESKHQVKSPSSKHVWPKVSRFCSKGFWPDGIYSPPTEEAMIWDLQQVLNIESTDLCFLSIKIKPFWLTFDNQTKALGFNMVRKHVKVEPRRCTSILVLIWTIIRFEM